MGFPHPHPIKFLDVSHGIKCTRFSPIFLLGNEIKI